MVAQRFQFAPDRVEVNQGDHVRIALHSADGTLGFAIKKLGTDVRVPRGAPVVVEFEVARAGVFRLACSEYCGRSHSRMKGVLVVKARVGD
jgi:heme/copper-type cytochrome/quinol oxidase subunit 2